MSDKNIFEENVRIPDIVNAKVDQALSALPDHGAIREVSPKKKENNRKTVTCVLAFAAAASVLLLSYSVYRAVRSGKEKDPSGSLISENTDRPDVTDNTENTDGTISQRFTIMVAGQGLRNDNSIPLENTTSRFAGISMSYGVFKFECEFPLSVSGDNVESVEYSFENADVAIAHNGTSPDNITGEKIDLDERYLSDWEDEPKRYYLGNAFFDEGTVDFYDSYIETSSSGYEENYQKYLCVQTEARTDLYQHVQLRERDGLDPFSCDFLTVLCQDIVVTIKVNFKDGSSEVADIGIKGADVPYIFQDEEGEEYTITMPGFVCYIKGSSEEPGEVHLRSFEEEGVDPESFSDYLDREPDPEVVQEQERMKELVDEKNILNDPDLPVIPYTIENGNGGIATIGDEDGCGWVSFGFPFIVNGDNVDHVEFRSLSENLCFYDYYTVGDEEYRIQGTESSNGAGKNDAAFAEDPENPKKGEQVYHYYSSFSMQYPVQELENYELYVEIDVRGNEELKAIDADVFTAKGYEDSEFFNTAFKNENIEMTVYYQDGTSVTKKIAFALILEPDEDSPYYGEEVPYFNLRNVYAYIVE